jgi:uncharacterized OsmC-like protein
VLEYEVHARRKDAHAGIAECKMAELAMDIDPAGRSDAFNPAELFLAAIAACMLKGIERVTPMIHFELDGVNVRLKAVRQDSPPRLLSVTYQLEVDSTESDQRLELLHTNVRKYGTIFNTVADAVNLSGTISRLPGRLSS